MSEFLNRFSFSSAQWSAEVAICAGVLWALLLWCAISSIRAQPFSATMRRFWVVVVIAVPIFGLLAYLPFSLPGKNRSLSGTTLRREPPPSG